MKYIPALDRLKINPDNEGKIVGRATAGRWSCDYAGLVIYGDFQAGAPSAEAVLADYLGGRLDFNRLIGSFRLVLTEASSGKQVIFTDNSGILCFYLDFAEKKFSESFLTLLQAKKNLRPNYQGITYFLLHNAIFSQETICADVERSDPNQYYVTENGRINVYSKNLRPFGAPQSFASLNSIIRRLVEATNELKTEAVITGGTDSRAILANLLALGIRPELSISGKAEHVDVKIARRIAEFLQLPLHISLDDPPESGTDWLLESFLAGDGVTGTLGYRRLYRKSVMIRDLGFQLEFGGASGELYKNIFIQQDYPFYSFGDPNLKRMHRVLFARSLPPDLIGEAIINPLSRLKGDLLNRLSHFGGRTKLQVYNEIGYFIMRCRITTISNLNYYACAHPLMERNAAALVYHRTPKLLEMASFQREEINRHYPLLADLPTSLGLSCSLAPQTLRREWLSTRSKDLIKMPLKALIRRFIPMGLDHRRDVCFDAGLKSDEYHHALTACKAMGLIPNWTRPENIPEALADRLLTVGLAFSPKQWDASQKSCGDALAIESDFAILSE